MKKLLFLIITTFSIFSCSSNSDGETKVEGQYVFKNDTSLVAINFSNGEPYLINTFIRSRSVSQIRNLSTSGDYPQMNVSYSSYPSEELQMNFKFIDLSSFTASVSVCKLNKGNWAWYYAHKTVVLPKQMNFKQDNTTLDMNGDGILDSTQGF